MDKIITIVSIIFIIGLWFLIIKKLVWSKCAPVKTVQAEVVDTYKEDRVSKYPGVFKGERYVVVFLVEGKKLSFAVSEFSYGHYNIKDKGMLTYKGSRIISFR